MNKKVSIYIHIPFCVSKCSYCSFNSYPIKYFSNEILENYFKSILEHIDYYKNCDLIVDTIFFGGGTPSIVKPEYIENILNFIYKNFKISKNCEISIEINPDSITEEKLKIYKSSGINRISIGIQSFNDKFLKFLGRAHNSYQAIKAIEIVRKYFNNLSIDLIFGILGQKILDLKSELEKIKEISPEHVSYYSLSIEENTKFYYQGVNEIDEILFGDMYDLIVNFLNETGIIQYEISNYSKKGYKCKHNLRYWNYEEYLGFGAGAVSFYQGKRWQNVKSPKEYANNFNKKEYEEILDEKTMEFEYIFMNLRKTEGLNLNDFKIKFKKDFIKKYYNVLNKLENYFIFNTKCVRLNSDGFKVSNLIFSEFLNVRR